MIGKRLVNTGGTAPLDPLQNFETVTYTGNGSTQKITGYIRKGASFNGSSSNITATSSTQGNTDASYSFWVNTDTILTYSASQPSYPVFGQTSDSARNPFTIFWYASTASGKMAFNIFRCFDNQLWSQTGYLTDFAYTFSANTWYHITLTYVASSKTVRCYVDGSEIGSGATLSLLAGGITTGTQMKIGAYNTVNYYNGKLDQVRIFDKALNSTEVGELALETYADPKKSTTDYFGDGSGIALYELDEDANDTGIPIDSGQSAVFNGSNSTMVLPLYNRGGNNNWSMSAWVNIPSDISGTIFAFFDGSVSYDQHLFFNLYQGRLQVGQYGSVAYSANTIPKNEWVHLAFTRSTSNNAKGYVNGQEVFNTTFATLNLKNEVPYIGSNYNNSSFFNGKIDEIRIYGDILTPTEIDYIVDNTVNIPSDNLLAHYKLDGNGNDETTNYSATSVNNITYSDPAVIAYNGTPTNINFLGITFQPDLVWIKERTSTSGHFISDSIRGATKVIYSNLTNSEDTETNVLTSFDTNGFTVGNSGGVNAGTDNYVAWCWKAGGSVTPNNNIDGTITSTVSANQDAGFSIVKWTGDGTNATMGHGLSSTPEMIIVKPLDSQTSGNDWKVYHSALGNLKIIYLNLTATPDSATSSFWGTINSSVFGQGGADVSYLNKLNYDYIAYCFHSVDGYQKVGSYTGVTTGVTVTTGFRPRFVMVKSSSNVEPWIILDTVRGSGVALSPNSSNAEYVTSGFTFTVSDTGFSLPHQDTADASVNQNGYTYIYLAIA